MWWDGVVDERLYVLFLQVGLQGVPVLAEDGEDVEDVVVLPVQPPPLAWQRDARVVDLAVETVGYLLATLVVFVQVLQLHVQQSRLYLVDATVAAHVVEDVLA